MSRDDVGARWGREGVLGASEHRGRRNYRAPAVYHLSEGRGAMCGAFSIKWGRCFTTDQLGRFLLLAREKPDIVCRDCAMWARETMEG